MFSYNIIICLTSQIVRSRSSILTRKLSNYSNKAININRAFLTWPEQSQICLPNTTAIGIVRHYAKGKDKKKEKGKGKVEVNESQLAEVLDIEGCKNQMEKAINVLKDDFIKNLSLRSTAGSIESLTIKLDGKDHTLQELAQVGRKNPKMLIVNMATFPQAIPNVLKAIEKSGMNLNPQQDGTTLYIPIPKVTREHRESLSKNAKSIFVKCKDAIRDVQIKHIKSLKKKDNLSTDLARNVEQQIVTIADKYISEAEKILISKQTELVGKD